MKTVNPIIIRTASILLLAVSSYANSQDWSYELEPYLLASSIEGDAGIGRSTGLPVDVNFGDILENLDIGFMAHFEAHHSNGWGVALDYGFMNLSADITGSRGGIVNAKVHQGVLEALLVRRKPLNDGYLDYLAGIRWWDNDIDVAVDPVLLPGSPTFSVKEDWVDVVLGMRWTNPINENWRFQLRGDIGGFGVQSDFTSSVSTGLRYRMTQSVELDLQYKATWVDFKSGAAGQPGYFKYDTITHGPVIGVVFNF